MDTGEKSDSVLVVDIGGTKIAAAVIDAGGNLLGKSRGSTPESSDAVDLVDEIERVARLALDAASMQFDAVPVLGISCAGIVNTREGVVAYSPNVASLRRTPLRAMLQERFGKPVRLANDATLAALGEWHFGLKRSVSDLVYVTLSTGIGGGLICGGVLQEGSCGGGGEVGHMTIEVHGPACPCGRNGCWESLASGRALAERTVEQLEAGESSILTDLSGGDMERVDAPLVALAARQGDRLAQEMVATTAFYVGVGLGNLINIFNPALILLGGGLTKIVDPILAPAIKTARERAYVASACDVEIRTALLGDDSPLFGAALLARTRTD